jgi:hypothetical protein
MRLLAAALVANLADLAMFLRASPSVVAADETSPLPHFLGQVPGGIVAKLVACLGIVMIVTVFRCQTRVRAALLILYTVVGIVGAASGILVGA